MMQARFFFQQLISGVSFCHAMVSQYLFCYTRVILLSDFVVGSCCFDLWYEGSVPSGLEIGEYIVRW